MGNSRKYPYPTTDGFQVLTPPPPLAFRNSIIVNLPPPLQNFRWFLEVYFRLSNAYMNKQTWIYASSRLWSSGARQQAFSDKKNLPLVARLCKLLFKSKFSYSSLFSCAVLMFTKQKSSNSDCKIIWQAFLESEGLVRVFYRSSDWSNKTGKR